MSIVVENLEKSFGSVQALKPTNLKIETGEFLTLVGPSGCGKTTLLRSIAGLEVPNKGKIELMGKTVFSSEEGIEVKTEDRGVGMVFQDFALWPHMTVFENVAFGLRARKDTDRLAERVEWALSRVQLSGYDHRYPKELSGGQQQRVSFARAIVTQPKIILLDEPLSALDAVLREGLRIILRSLTNELGLTAVYVTHDQHEAMSISDRIVVMQSGEMLQSGVPEDVYNKPNQLFIAEFVGKTNFLPEDDDADGNAAAANDVGANGVSDRQFKMTRPESLSTTRRSKNDLEFTGEIEMVAYVGDRYEVHLNVEGKNWIAYFSERPKSDEKITLYLPPEKIHSIKDSAKEGLI